jgi:inactivated superfamily I helicase
MTTAPRTLGEAGKRLWKAVMAAGTLNEPQRARLHRLAQLEDELNRLREELRTAPVMVAGSTGQPVAHPLFREVREHHETVQRGLRELVQDAGLREPRLLHFDSPEGVELERLRARARARHQRANGG